MYDKAEKIYGEAFFELCCEENEAALGSTLEELKALDEIFTANPGFAKIMSTPTISAEDKISLCREIISAGNVSELTGNLLCVLTENGRMGCFSGIVKEFREMYNDKFRLTEIVVTTASPLSSELKNKIAAKMSEVIGKTVTVNEKIDKNIIGGIVIDYGSRRYDGSIKARLDSLRKELGSVIA